MSKRGPRFTGKEKLPIVKEGEKNGVNAACAKYGMSDQSYRYWRYKAAGIQPRKQFSTEEKLQTLEEGYPNGIERVCAAYRINPRTYYRWKKVDFTKSLRRSFTEKEQLLIVKDAIRDGICKASRKHKVNGAKVHGWAQQLGLQIPRAAGRFTAQEKLRILEEGYQNGISRVCNAYQIDLTTSRTPKRHCFHKLEREVGVGETGYVLIQLGDEFFPRQTGLAEQLVIADVPASALASWSEITASSRLPSVTFGPDHGPPRSPLQCGFSAGCLS